MQYRNATFAFVGELRAIEARGVTVSPRGSETQEILARTVQLARPLERCVTVPGRRNDPFAAIAETMWVLAGRDDVAWLERYLKRAPDYSDDGVVWRAGYGPRLRDWTGVDQIAEVVRILHEDPSSRRAVAVLFDPARDFVESKDIPCNNWLHFLNRGGELHMNVVLRSNDLMWGFSGINTFEWSVLHEAMAYWLGLKVGPVSFFISSLHLYDGFDGRVRDVLASFSNRSGYELGWRNEPFETSWAELPGVIASWYELERRLADGDEVDGEINAFSDPLLRGFLRAIRVKWAKAYGAEEGRIRDLVDELGTTDLAFAVHEWLFRDSRDLPAVDAEPLDLEDLSRTIGSLHRRKDAGYGPSWKRRGELVSIAANLARKADRIETIVGGADQGAESLLDTAVDLLVYSLKYETYVADQDPAVAGRVMAGTGPFSDGPLGFEQRLNALTMPDDSVDIEAEATATLSAFNTLEDFMRGHPADWSVKFELAEQLAFASARLVVAVAKQDWSALQKLREEAGV